MSYSWSDDARLRFTKNTSSYLDSYMLVSSYGAWWVYWGNADAYGAVKAPAAVTTNSFPNLHPNDAMQSAPSTNTYNCAAWAGGKSDCWAWGQCYTSNSGSPIPGTNYGSVNSWSTWDDFFGNNPPRYIGATNYTRTSANYNNGEVAVWSTTTGINGVTHFSVRAEGNNHPHGYDWESKPGALERTFHPRTALSGVSYGNIIDYYRDSSKPIDTYYNKNIAQQHSKEETFSFEESLKLGLTTLQVVELNEYEYEKLVEMLKTVNINYIKKYYDAWIDEVSSEEYLKYSNPMVFIENEKCIDLLSYCIENKDIALPYFMDKIFNSKLNTFELYLNELVFAGIAYDEYNYLMEEVKEEWERNSYNNKGEYLAPTVDANAKKYIKKILAAIGKSQKTTNDSKNIIMNSYKRFSVYPNPIEDISTIGVSINDDAFVTLEVYDLNLKKIEQLNNSTLNKGDYQYTIKRENYNSGLYICKLMINDEEYVRKIFFK